MNYYLKFNQHPVEAKLKISGSKSETNRLLILQALFPDITIENPSDSDDSRILEKALSQDDEIVNINHCGTAMRFLTAYYAFIPGERILTGSQRMQNRPIKLLVDALKEMGAEIDYCGKEGFPPLQIKGRKVMKNEISVNAAISSQYISALLLIAPSLSKGVSMHLQGKILSQPYIDMTLGFLKELGVKTIVDKNTICVFPMNKIPRKTISIESDWSSASYFYSLVALAESADIRLSIFRKESLQGDRIIAEIYEQFGVKTSYEENSIRLQKVKIKSLPKKIEMDLSNYPDLAPTTAVTCLGLQIPSLLTGLDNLKFKETDRLKALKNELSKFGATVKIKDGNLHSIPASKLKPDILVETYQDHRMAMAFAPLALKTPLYIEDPGVVSKSFLNFWECLQKCSVDWRID